MSSPINAITPSLFTPPPPVSFIAANGTAAKVVVDQMAAAIATTLAPQVYGGGTIIDLVATSSDASPKDVLLYDCTVATVQGGATGTMTTTTSTIPRSSGSYIADGLLVGDQVMTFAPFGTAPNAGVDGIPCTVTAVTALGLTLNGTPIAAVTLAAGTRICRIRPHVRQTVPAGAGTASGVPSQALIGQFSDGSLVRTELKLGPNTIIAAAMQAAVSALPAVVSIGARVAQY